MSCKLLNKDQIVAADCKRWTSCLLVLLVAIDRSPRMDWSVIEWASDSVSHAPKACKDQLMVSRTTEGHQVTFVTPWHARQRSLNFASSHLWNLNLLTPSMLVPNNQILDPHSCPAQVTQLCPLQAHSRVQAVPQTPTST